MADGTDTWGDVKTRFVLFSAARSGTSATMSAMRTHPDVFSHGEVFDFGVPQNPKRTRNKIKWEYRDRFPIDPVEAKTPGFAYKILNFTPGPSTVGFKMWHGQCPEASEVLLADRKIRKIILERRNRLASFSSRTILENSASDATSGTRKISEFDSKAFKKYVRKIDNTFATYRNLAAGRVFHLDYTELKDQTIQEILDFLGLESVGPGLTSKKQNDSAILERYSPELQDEVFNCLEVIGHPEWVAE